MLSSSRSSRTQNDPRMAQEDSVITQAQAPSKTFLTTFVISLLLHGSVLALLLDSDWTVTFSSRPAGNATFEISLVDNQVSHARPNPDHPKTTSKHAAAPPARQVQQASDDKHAAAQQPLEAPTPTNYTVPATTSIASNDMMKYLETEFRTRFHYPAMARQRGWEGKVIVGLDVNKAGFIHNVNVKHSSGYSVLDNNAKRTFEQIGNVLPVLSKDNRQNYQFTIPVIYMLTKG